LIRILFTFFSFTFKQAEASPECQKNSIRDLFIRPVQRIPSVLLLLQGKYSKFPYVA